MVGSYQDTAVESLSLFYINDIAWRGNQRSKFSANANVESTNNRSRLMCRNANDHIYTTAVSLPPQRGDSHGCVCFDGKSRRPQTKHWTERGKVAQHYPVFTSATACRRIQIDSRLQVLGVWQRPSVCVVLISHLTVQMQVVQVPYLLSKFYFAPWSWFVDSSSERVEIGADQ